VNVAPLLALAFAAAACGAAPPPLPPAAATAPAPSPEIAAAFAAESATGTMVVRRLGDGREWVHAPARADSAFLPASTFKIPNAAIALETGAVSGTEEAFPWDGTEHPFGGWNRDHTLRTAMPASAVPVFQEIARRIGEARMGEWLARLDYGNADVGGGIDQFWLRGDLRISAREQADFLARFVAGETPFSARTRADVADILVNERGEEWTLYAKTGWAFEVQLGWWAGWTEHRGETYVFAMNMQMPDSSADPPKRIRIGRAALAAVGALPAEAAAPR
jgi:beta-lactamase class D